MKPKFATWFFLSLVLGHFSETFTKSYHAKSKSDTTYSDLATVKWVLSKRYYITTTTILENVSSVPTFASGFNLHKVSEKTKPLQVMETQEDTDETTNFTILRNGKKDDKFLSKLSPLGDYVFGSLLLISCILALLGNGCALTIFGFRQRRLIPMEVFFINLAVADVLLSVASYPMSIVASFKHEWIFGEIGCKIYAFLCYFLSLSSIYTITAMAVFRYLITCKPAQGNLITYWTCCKMVATCYLLAFIWSAFPLFGFGNYEVEPFGLSCTLDWIAKDAASRIYMVLVTIFCVLLPLIILIFCYTSIIILVKQSNVLMKNTGVHRSNTNRSNGQLTLICGLISTGFVIAWFPYTIACLWTSFKGELVIPVWATPGPVMFAKSSIIYNPIIYVFMTARYRKDFNDLIKLISCKSSGVSEIEKNDNTNTGTATNGDESNFHQGGPSTMVFGMEEKIEEFSTRYVPSSMKQTYV